jgi:hypothetical protein
MRYLVGNKFVNVDDLLVRGGIACYKLDIVWNQSDKVIDNSFGRSLALVILGVFHTLLSSPTGTEHLDGGESYSNERITMLDKWKNPLFS